MTPLQSASGTSPIVAVEWRPVLGFEDRYLVSSDGRVWSVYFDRLMSVRPLPAGYLVCTLRNAEKNHTRLIHRIVAEVFCGGYSKELTVNHKDGIKTNNCVANLEWTTWAQNNQHARDTGLLDRRGTKNNFTIITEDNVRDIRKGLSAGIAPKILAEKYGTTDKNISCIKRGISWKHVK